MESEAIDLGHVGSGGVRADGLQNVLIGMGTGRDKAQYTKTTATLIFMLTKPRGKASKYCLAETASEPKKCRALNK